MSSTQQERDVRSRCCDSLGKMIPMDRIVSDLRDFVLDEILYASDVNDVAADQELLTSDLLDSLASAQLMVHVEQTYSIQLQPTDLTLENFNTLSALATLVYRYTTQ